MKYRIIKNGKVIGISEFPIESNETDEIIEEITEEQFNSISNQFKQEQNALEQENIKISKILNRLDELSKDFIQEYLGRIRPDFEERRREFIELHQEILKLEGKEPAIYKIDEN